MLAAGSFALEWLQLRLLVRTHPVEVWLALPSAIFLGLGVWVGARLFRPAAPTPFQTNTRVQETLRISGRELEVLQLLAAGQSNKEIAIRLEVSPNTVKTHVARLFKSSR